jgi:prolyl-tRNA synthetase
MVNIMISNIKDNQQVEFGENLYQELQDLNISVILDDRKERFGAKIKDAELIGFPYTVIIGKNLKDEKVQILIRLTNEKLTISSNNVLETLKALI